MQVRFERKENNFDGKRVFFLGSVFQNNVALYNRNRGFVAEILVVIHTILLTSTN